MLDLFGKVKMLNLVPISDEIYQEYLNPHELAGVDVSKYKYIKFYGNTPIYYSVDYLEQTFINQLIAMDKRNSDYFQPSWRKRIKQNLQARFLRLGWF